MSPHQNNSEAVAQIHPELAPKNSSDSPQQITHVSEDPFKPLEAPEIVFGLVGPLGADLEKVCEELKQVLQSVEYGYEEIRLSNILKEINGLEVDLIPHPENARIHSYMVAGTKFREALERGDALALAAIAKIKEIRESTTGNPVMPAKGKAYVLRSLKHKAEIEALRNVYGRAFFVISAYSPREERKKALAEKIAKSNHDTSNRTKYYHAAEKLIDEDLKEHGNNLGQDVTGAFPLADLFVDVTSVTSVKESIQRFVEIIFGYPYHTPSKNEFGMFQARTAALRSADLSRQVGAAIMTEEGDIIALGCNEVPKAGGGQYWSNDGADSRDFVKGFDSSVKMKREMLCETLKILQDGKYLSDEYAAADINEMVSTFMDGKTEAAMSFKEAQISNILEFGRIVHAEMAAITDAARRGIKLKNAILYTTTFPCHMCARHIIAAGIKKVIYIEPYPKSKAAELYDDSISVDQHIESEEKVSFHSFVGISPQKYLDAFSMPERKDKKTGVIIPWQASKAKLRLQRFVASYIHIEDKAIAGWLTKMREAKLEI